MMSMTQVYQTLYKLHRLRAEYAELEGQLKQHGITETFYLEEVNVDPVAIVNSNGVTFIAAKAIQQPKDYVDVEPTIEEQTFDPLENDIMTSDDYLPEDATAGTPK